MLLIFSHEPYVSPKQPSCVLPVCLLCSLLLLRRRRRCGGRVQSDLVQRIAEMVDAKQLDGITDVRDESDRTGARTRRCRLLCMLQPRALCGHWRLGHHTDSETGQATVSATLGVQCATMRLQQHPPLPGCADVNMYKHAVALMLQVCGWLWRSSGASHPSWCSTSCTRVHACSCASQPTWCARVCVCVCVCTLVTACVSGH